MKNILIVYHSQQKGNTRKLAELVAEGCRQVEGVEAELINVNEARVDTTAVEAADGLALGSPDYFSYMAGGLKQFFDDVLIAHYNERKVQGKPYVAFCTHGGGGKAIESVEKLASSQKFVQVADSVLCRRAETQEDKDKGVALGKALAEHVVGS